MLEDQIHGPYTTDLEPALAPGAYVELLPDDVVREVTVAEVIPTVETKTVTVPANDTQSEVEMRQLYAQDGVLAQFRLVDPDGGQAIPDGIEITVDHGGEESPRFNLKNARGFYNADTPGFGDSGQQTELFEWQDSDLFFNFTNTTGAEIDVTLTYTGYAYNTVAAGGETPDISVLTERFSLRR